MEGWGERRMGNGGQEVIGGSQIRRVSGGGAGISLDGRKCKGEK